MKLLKTLVISVLAISLVLGIALPALASSRAVTAQPSLPLLQDNGKGNPNKSNVQVVKGTVTGITGNVITVEGKDIVTNNQTGYKVPGNKNATLADIQVGMQITAQTRLDNGNLYARQIVVAPQAASRVQNTGNVTAYTNDPATGGSITILDKSGQSITFAIVAGKLQVLPKGANVTVGARVTVIGRRNPGQNTLTATIIVVRPIVRPLQQITGNITALTQPTDNFTGTITIGTTILKYDANTTFTMRGALGVAVGQQATVYYRAQTDGTLLAKRVLVGIKPPTPKPLPKQPAIRAQARPKST